MQLTTEQQNQIRERCGVIANERCDVCSQVWDGSGSPDAESPASIVPGGAKTAKSAQSSSGKAEVKT